MTEYTSLDISKRLAEVGFKEEYDGRCWIHTDNERLAGSFLGYRTANSTENVIADAYRADTLLSWLLSHGDSIEITPDLDGFNCTYWVKHEDYNGINIFLCDALAEVILQVLAREVDK